MTGRVKQGEKVRWRHPHPAGFGALTTCPECGSGELIAVTDGDVTNFLCEACRRCWHLEMGYVHQVDPASSTDAERPG